MVECVIDVQYVICNQSIALFTNTQDCYFDVFLLLRVAIIREHIIQRMYKVLKYIVTIDKWYTHSNLTIGK
jgi:hypothetical protein